MVDFSDIYVTQSMTGPSAPSDDVTASSEYSASYQAWEAFVQDSAITDTYSWASENVAISEGSPQWLKYHFDTPVTVSAFKFKVRAKVGEYNYPEDFKLQGSNNDSDWTDLYTKSGYTDITAYSLGSDIFEIAIPGSYSYYRLLITKRYDAASTNWVALGRLELYGAYFPATPFMLSASTPSGVVSADTEYSAEYPAWEAFRGFRKNTVCWISADTTPTEGSPHWLKYDFGSGGDRTISAYAFRARNDANHPHPSDFKLQGSNNDSDWTDLDSVSGLTDIGTDGISPIYSVDSPDSYRYYRLLITGSTGTGWVAVGQMYLFQAAPETDKIEAEPGSYVITGSDVNLINGMSVLTADPGSYAITGTDVELRINKIEAESGTYTLTGSDVGLVEPRFIQPESGVYALTGSNADLIFPRFIQPTPGAYTITGSDIDFAIGTGPAITGTIAYLFTLTGAPDSTTDIEIPISSFQARLRSGSPTYLQVVIPGLDYATAINTRPNGVMEIDMAVLVNGEYTQRETIIQANLEDIDPHRGTTNKSIVLIGHKQKTYSAKSITLTGATYQRARNGSIRYRLAEPNVYLHPGDSVTIDTDTFDANVISYSVAARTGGISTTMELSEA